MGKRSKKVIFWGMIGLTVLFGVIAWNSTVFCDFYVKNVFPIWLNTLGRISNLFPFSIGECMIVTGIILLLIALVLLFFLPVKKFRKGIKKYYVFFAWVLNGLAMVLMLNSIMLYHTSTLPETEFCNTSEEYSILDLIKVRNLVAEKCNQLSKQMVRDEEGEILYGSVAKTYLETGVVPENAGSIMDQEIRAKAVEAMKHLGETYPRLSGFYPNPKPIYFSDLMSQEYVSGIYYPFSMEANYNTVMSLMNKPFTMCHELAHIKGYIYEDEANILGYMACVESDDPLLQYSGYLSVLYYLDEDIKAAKKQNPVGYFRALETDPVVKVTSRVYADDVFVSAGEWDRINGKAIVKTETVASVSSKVMDANLKLNGVEEGSISYSKVVELLMRYYDSKIIKI